MVGHAGRVQVNLGLGELLDHLEQQVGFVEFFYLLFKLKMLQDVACLFAEAFEVMRQVGGQLVWVA